MRTYDLTPLLRSSVGFDQFDRLFNAVQRGDESVNYPPYNIEKLDEDDYRISMAVAGFGEDELDVTVSENSLVVTAKPAAEETQVKYLHRGIARRAFERRFELAANIVVTAAALKNGLLQIELKRQVPEHLKPRRIEIGGATTVEQPRVAA
ncbi:MAG: Hsp20 family protein [Alphaproteobacteria bacterium]